MAGRSLFFVLLVTLSSLAFSAYAETEVNPDSPHKTTIVLHNKFSSPATFHCKSKSDDRGSHVVRPGESYGFVVNFESSDLYMFFCDLQGGGKQGIYDIYDSSRDLTRCSGTCNWDVSGSGISGYKQGSSVADIVFRWP